MSGASALGEFASFAESQMRIGKRQAGDGVFRASQQGIMLIGQRHVDMSRPKDFQIAIEAANVEMESADKTGPGLRTSA